MALGSWVYMMTNRPHGMLYIGITAYLARGFTSIGSIPGRRTVGGTG